MSRAPRTESPLVPLPPSSDPRTRVALGPGENDPALRNGDHAAFLYRDPDEVVALAVPYLAEGLRAGDRVVYVADDTPIERIRAGLLAAGVDVDAETAAGRLTLATSTDAFFAEGRFDVERAIEGVRASIDEAVAAGHPRVRFSVEMTYLLRDVPGIERGLEFEARVNDEVFEGRPVVCICSFNVTRDDGRVLVDVLRSHQVLVQDGGTWENTAYVRWEAKVD